MSPERSGKHQRTQAASPSDRPEPVSKTRRKREMLTRQDIGEELVALSDTQLARLELPEPLREAVQTARRIRKFGALRRQLQYIGRLMREVDVVAVEAQLDVWKGRSRQATAHLHALERWRDRLICDDRAMSELAAAYPGCDLQTLRNLVRGARREQALGEPHQSARALFQALRQVVPQPGAPDSVVED